MSYISIDQDLKKIEMKHRTIDTYDESMQKYIRHGQFNSAFQKGFNYELVDTTFEMPFKEGLFGLFAEGYSKHRNVIVTPDDLWIYISSQLKRIIEENVEYYRHLFTDSDTKKDISVPSDSLTILPVEAVVSKLLKLLNFDGNLVLPEFSTSLPEHRLTKASMLLDMSKHYYNYIMFCCGLRGVKLEGTLEDWLLIKSSFDTISELFNISGQKYSEWVSGTKYVIDMFIAGYNGDSTGFIDIFTSKNKGSGSQLYIDGWLTKLLYDKPTDMKLKNFECDFATFEYKSMDTGKEYVAVTGGMHIHQNEDDDSISLKYGRVIFNKIPE